MRKVIFLCLRDNSAYPAAGRELCGARGVKADSPIRRGGQAQQFIFHFHFSILIHHLVTFAHDYNRSSKGISRSQGRVEEASLTLMAN